MGIYLLNKSAMGYSLLATRLQAAGETPVQCAYSITALPEPPWRNMIILTDWQQLDLTEREALLAAASTHPTIIMVITSSHFSCQDARRIMRSGRCDLVNAPASDEALERAVWTAVERSRLVQQQLIAHDKAVHCLAKLTIREKQILGALATGASSKMAARQLGLSPPRWRFIAPIWCAAAAWRMLPIWSKRIWRWSSIAASQHSESPASADSRAVYALRCRRPPFPIPPHISDFPAGPAVSSRDLLIPC